MENLQFRVPVYFTIFTPNAKEAERLISESFPNRDVGSAEYVGMSDDKPEISKELREFLAAEIEANDNDHDGWGTDLDYVKSTLMQMPNDLVRKQAEYKGEDSDDVFAEMLQNEFDDLYDRFGGATAVQDLID